MTDTDRLEQIRLLEAALNERNAELKRVRDQRDVLRAERDKARRMYCVMRDGEDGLNCKEWANRKNWDCFKENTDV